MDTQISLKERNSNLQLMKSHLTEEDQHYVENIVSEAMANYPLMQMDPPTYLDMEFFKAEVTKSVIGSVELMNQRYDSQFERSVARANRLSIVNQKANLLGIKFQHNRRKEIQILDESVELIPGSGYSRIVSTGREVNSSLGGETMAYKYVLSPDNEIMRNYSIAFCRKDEPFDPILGKEIALDKFIRERTLTELTPADFLGPVKFDKLSRLYRLAFPLNK